MAKLYDIIQNADKGKTPIGYNVKSYKDVLIDLQKDIVSQPVQQVFGTGRGDFSGINSMSFDSTSGISNHLTSCLWKMKLQVCGSVPITIDGYYEIVNFQGNTDLNTDRNPFTEPHKFCPLTLDTQVLNGLKSAGVIDFKIGASLDLSNFGKKYFNTFYSSTTGVKQGFTDDVIMNLFSNNLLQAQIIIPTDNTTINGNDSRIVDIIGQSPKLGANACCYLTTPLLGSSQWQDSGIVLHIKDSIGKHQLIPNGSPYKFTAQGKHYTAGLAKMQGLNINEYERWLRQDYSNRVGEGGVQTLKLLRIQEVECYVKIFIPQSKKREALRFLPENCSELIFQQFNMVLPQTVNDDWLYNGKALDGMQRVCEKWKNVKVAQENGGFWYSQEKRPSRLYRGQGSVYTDGINTSIKPKFGRNTEGGYFDCSSLVFLFWYDADILKEDVTDAPTFTTETLDSVPDDDELKGKLRDNLQIIKMDIDKTTKILTGDIMWKPGHAAMAYIVDGRIYTLEINEKENTNQRPVCWHRPRNENSSSAAQYTKLLRVVEKQAQ